jgi:hypothetical protein
MKADRFERVDRVQARLRCGPEQIVRDGYIKRAYGSGAYNVILDKPLSAGRQDYCEPDEVFAPAQEDLFPRS